jgi:uncharacterized lipoprotein
MKRLALVAAVLAVAACSTSESKPNATDTAKPAMAAPAPAPAAADSTKKDTAAMGGMKMDTKDPKAPPARKP